MQKTYTKKNPDFVRGPAGKQSFTMGGKERVFAPARTAVGLGSVPFFATQVAQMFDADKILKKLPRGID